MVRREIPSENGLVKEYFSNYYENYTIFAKGIFEVIHEEWGFDFPLPIEEGYSVVKNGYMDRLFVGKYGERNLSPLVVGVAKTTTQWDNDYFGYGALSSLAGHIYPRFRDKWTKLTSLLSLEYDPIHNYLDEWQDESDRDKTGSNSFTSTRQDTLNTLETTQSTRTDNLLSTKTINESESTTDTQTDGIFGFNSSTSSNADKSDGSSSKTTIGTDTDANTGTQGLSQTVADTGTNTRGTQEAGSETENEDIARSGSHSGNIGNITTQKMIKEEIELWRWRIIDEMLEDVASIVTLPIYLNEWEEIERKKL